MVNANTDPLVGMPVDPIVLVEHDNPELRANGGIYAPPPAQRPKPERPVLQPVGEWQPDGGAPTATPPHRAGQVVRAVILGLIPIVLAITIVYGVMRAYGLPL